LMSDVTFAPSFRLASAIGYLSCSFHQAESGIPMPPNQLNA